MLKDEQSRGKFVRVPHLYNYNCSNTHSSFISSKLTPFIGINLGLLIFFVL